MFWSKNKKKLISYKELASHIKGEVASLINDAMHVPLTPVELILLNRLSKYLDTFLTRCLKDNRLLHKHWITARLLETSLILRTSTSSSVQKLVRNIDNLQYMIMAGKTDGNKRNENSGGNRPPLS